MIVALNRSCDVGDSYR